MHWLRRFHFPLPLTLVLVCILPAFFPGGEAGAAIAADSVGTEYRAGVRYLVHEVRSGETLFSLSRKYGVTVDEIRDGNSGLGESLRVGSRVLIPRGRGQQVAQESPGDIYHTVQASETLYSISRKYGVSLENLKSWNRLTDNNLAVGTRLIVGRRGDSAAPAPSATGSNNAAGRKIHRVEAGQTMFSISRMYGISTDELRVWNGLSDMNLRVGQELLVSAPGTGSDAQPSSSMLPSGTTGSRPAAETTAPPEALRSERSAEAEQVVREAPKSSEKVVEKGLAEVIENDTDTRKYLALHRSAPVGTIMQIRNEMNNQIVFVRVVGTIPDAGDNRRILVRISQKAFERLGAVDARFPVEISYMP
jgi:LysM repeat protein